MTAEAFVGALGLVTLVLALHRDESRRHGDRAARAAAEVARAHDLFASVLSAATEHAIVGVDTTGRITVFNEGAERMLGWPAAEAIGEDVRPLLVRGELHARAGALGLDDVDALFRTSHGDGPHTERATYVRRDGTRLPVMLTDAPMHDDTGALIGHILLATDLTARLAAEAELADSERLFRVAFDTAPVGMVMVGLTGPGARRILRVNETMERFTGRAEDQLLAMTLQDLAPAEDVAACRDAFDAVVADPSRPVRCVRTFEHADGRVLWAEMSATVLHPSGRDPYLFCLVQDVTLRRAAERDLEHLALHDPLTGLANRRLFVAQLEQAVAACGPADGVGVLYVDLDGFKAVNDSLGHAAGDELLRRVADLLVHAVRPADTVARLGGDEFAVVCADADVTEADLAGIGARLLQSLALPVALEGGEACVGASIGVVRGDAGTPGDALLRAADAAMYAAKRAGKGRVVVRPAHAVPTTVGQPLFT
nr:diguanylate cyclase [Kineococcus siccus]